MSEQGRGRHGNQREALDSISLAAFDVDARIFRTLWHSIVRTPDVALAALKGEYDIYLSPIRVFVALISLQIVIAATVGLPMVLTVETMTTDLEPARLTAWLGPHTAQSVNAQLEDSLSLLLWPLMIITSIPYVVTLKLFRPSVKLWGHLMLYLTATNGSTVVMTLMMASYLFSAVIFSLTIPAYLIIFLVLSGRLISRFYAETAGGTIVRICILSVVTVLVFTANVVGQFAAAGWVLQNEFGLNLLDLYAPPQTTE